MRDHHVELTLIVLSALASYYAAGVAVLVLAMVLQ